jgi:hypothetical protein
MELYTLIHLVWYSEVDDLRDIHDSNKLLGNYSTFENACIQAFNIQYDGSWSPHILICKTSLDQKIKCDISYDYYNNGDNNNVYIVNKHEKCIFDKKNKKIVYGDKEQSILPLYLEILTYGNNAKEYNMLKYTPSNKTEKRILSKILKLENKLLHIPSDKLILCPNFHPIYDGEYYPGYRGWDNDEDDKYRCANPSFIFGRSLCELKYIKELIES